MSAPAESASERFDPDCRACPRLAAFLDSTRAQYPAYHCSPVAPFGAAAPALLIVGLAPGLHGANATGRPFTGDHAGGLLYETLYRIGRSNRAQAVARDDGLELDDCAITNAVKCVPPKNKPNGAEIKRCNAFLAAELAALPTPAVVVALGRIAHDAVLAATGRRRRDFPFAHGAEHALSPTLSLLDSYHCSRYNTQTGRLTRDMFEAVFRRADALARRGRS